MRARLHAGAYGAPYESSYLRYLRLAKNAPDIADNGRSVPVELRLIDEQTFAHKGRMDFVDNAIDRSSARR